MQLSQYANDVITKGALPTNFPPHLDVPRAFVQYCYSLYTTGEARSRERGVSMSVSLTGDIAFATDVVEGTATGINLPYVESDRAFGDLHCHPADSIGHKKGYAAHSPEDVVSMRPQTAKPLFARFVCSGTLIYAMVYRKGHSTIVEKDVFAIRDTNNDLAQQ